jgi:hypothetical protein
MNCKICCREAQEKFKYKILNKYLVQYYFCDNCSFLFTENPYWLEESYKNPINLSDTGILDRNLYFRKVVSSLIFFFFNKNKAFLDYAGGYGIFTRLMRDIGFDFYWTDKFTQNILARGFEYSKFQIGSLEALTTFEVFEHLPDPVTELEKLINISSNIIFSTELLPLPVPEPGKWWYYGFNHGQHISFYSKKTLIFLANKMGMNLYSCGYIHLISKKKINPFLFKIIVKSSKYGLGFIISKLNKSKTWEDHLLLDKTIQ